MNKIEDNIISKIVGLLLRLFVAFPFFGGAVAKFGEVIKNGSFEPIKAMAEGYLGFGVNPVTGFGWLPEFWSMFIPVTAVVLPFFELAVVLIFVLGYRMRISASIVLFVVLNWLLMGTFIPNAFLAVALIIIIVFPRATEAFGINMLLKKSENK